MYNIKPLLKEKGYNLSKIPQKQDMSTHQFVKHVTVKPESKGVNA